MLVESKYFIEASKFSVRTRTVLFAFSRGDLAGVTCVSDDAARNSVLKYRSYVRGKQGG
jgi:hypothetical protein